jgi:CDP-diacylglycerol--glycerol-3-phosphate 3-phosphatidyltransferase
VLSAALTAENKEAQYMSLRSQLETEVRSRVGAIVQHTLARTSLSPNTLTLLGLVLTFGVAALIARGDLFWAGVLLVISGGFDMLDGALARAKQQTSRFGAFLDSTLDRYSDALILLGLLIYYQRVAPQSIELVLTLVACFGALLTSYVRARAESLGFRCKVGLLERPERIVLIIVGLLTGWVSPMVWALAVLANITAVQRLIHVWHADQVEQSGHSRTPLTQGGE